MKLDRYELKSGEELEVFEFVSVGVKGRIIKLVQYTPTNYKDLYNLGFGDKNAETGETEIGWEKFKINIEYEAFLVTRKN